MLKKPLVVFDLETTGLNLQQDKIIEIGILKINPTGDNELFQSYINPKMDIPEIVTDITGIDNETVKDAPTFKEVADEVYELIGDSDLCGYNSNAFDIPILTAEFKRSVIKFNLDNRALIDVCYIFKSKERRNLANAFKFYCDEDLKNSHSAMADLQATWKILQEQVRRYPELSLDSEVLHKASKDESSVDLANRLKMDREGFVCINFGKHKNKRVVDLMISEPNYIKWILDSDFTEDTKSYLKKIVYDKVN